jgi:hypothetical protein
MHFAPLSPPAPHWVSVLPRIRSSTHSPGKPESASSRRNAPMTERSGISCPGGGCGEFLLVSVEFSPEQRKGGALEPSKHLSGTLARVTIKGWSLTPTEARKVWSFILDERNGRTRLISRNRFRLPRLKDKIGMIPMEPGSLFMERKMLMGIKNRAEKLAAEQAVTHS